MQNRLNILLLAWLCSWFLVLSWVSPTMAKKPRKLWVTFSPEMIVSYDSNIFLYSPDDIDDFVDGKKADQFAAIESYDDAIFTQSAKAYFYYRWNSDWLSRLRLNLRQRHYSVNEQKDYYTLAVHWRQYYDDWGHLQLGYFHMPRYHIRHLYDTDTDQYEPCEYEDHIFSIKTLWEWKKTDVTVGYEYQINDYNSYFREYDNESDSFLLEIDQTIGRQLRLGLEYEYKHLVADGVDEPGEDYETSDDSDISYNQQIFGVSIGNIPCKILPLSHSLSYSYRFRTYTTDKTIIEDPYHAEREDTEHELTWDVETIFSKRWTFKLGYQYDHRDVESPKKEQITDVKNYRRHTINIGMEFDYSTTLMR